MGGTGRQGNEGSSGRGEVPRFASQGMGPNSFFLARFFGDVVLFAGFAVVVTAQGVEND